MNPDNESKELEQQVEREVQRRVNKVVGLIVVSIVILLGMAYAMVAWNLNVTYVAGAMVLFGILEAWLANRIKKGRL
ncbi:MAG: hypothetical protein N2318_01625 [Meiothermus sp.]|nr:hypothetical protein [Meiothermus sp.]